MRQALLVLLVAVVSIATGRPAPAAGCSAQERARREAAVASFKRTMPSARRAYFRTHTHAKDRAAFLDRQRERLRRLETALEACGPVEGPQQLLPFYPQAGLLGRDLYIYNHVDLDPGPGIRDFDCGAQTYDGHGGEDSIIRSFREQEIGVPVFAALDGTVVEVIDHLPDHSYGTNTTPVDNHVILDHGNLQQTVYGHLRRESITVRVGQHVVAGQQLGLTGSSGNSSGPHLHFTVRRSYEPYEPFAGPCRPGTSGWVSQPALPHALYVRDFTFSPDPFAGRADLPWDEAVRTGSFLAGVRDVYFRIDVANLYEDLPVHVRVVRPDGAVAVDDAAAARFPLLRATSQNWHYRIDLEQAGSWRLLVDAGGAPLVDAPFDVATAPVPNRPPGPIAVSVTRAGPVAVCSVQTSLVTEDPDYDIVRYRYRWSRAGTTVRQVTSAALSDVVPARGDAPLACTVTPSDGRADGPTAAAAG